MVILRRIDGCSNKARYRYYPEGKETYGIVSLDPGTNDRNIEKIAEGYSRTYAFHALHRLEEYNEKSEYPAEDMVAWY